jgi:hypothetical protein
MMNPNGEKIYPYSGKVPYIVGNLILELSLIAGIIFLGTRLQAQRAETEQLRQQINQTAEVEPK